MKVEEAKAGIGFGPNRVGNHDPESAYVRRAFPLEPMAASPDERAGPRG